MKLCLRCQTPLAKRDDEPRSKFEQRRHCNKACGRPRGQRMSSAQATLTDEQVRLIRKSADHAQILAERFGISDSHVRNIKARRTWAWLED